MQLPVSRLSSSLGETSSYPLATGSEPPTDYSLDNPFDLTQRS